MSVAATALDCRDLDTSDVAVGAQAYDQITQHIASIANSDQRTVAMAPIARLAPREIPEKPDTPHVSLKALDPRCDVEPSRRDDSDLSNVIVSILCTEKDDLKDAKDAKDLVMDRLPIIRALLIEAIRSPPGKLDIIPEVKMYLDPDFYFTKHSQNEMSTPEHSRFIDRPILKAVFIGTFLTKYTCKYQRDRLPATLLEEVRAAAASASALPTAP